MERVMSPEEELELPPWTKYSRYGLFPSKLVLHLLLLVLVTFQAVSVNVLFAPYSRSMWSSAVSIFFPPNYQSQQSSLTSPYQYFIFTQNQTVNDGNRLFEAYFSMPYTSVNQLDIYNESLPSSLLQQPPSVKVTKTDGSSETFNVATLQSLGNSWPLGSNMSVVSSPASLRDFFRSMYSLDFSFPLVSYGNNANLKVPTDVCYKWQINFLYDLSSTGQILVTATSDMVGVCQPMNTVSWLYISSFAIAVLSTLYQILILKASARRILILHSIRMSVAQEGQQMSTENHNCNQESAENKIDASSFLNAQHPMHVSANSSIDAALDLDADEADEKLDSSSLIAPGNTTILSRGYTDTGVPVYDNSYSLNSTPQSPSAHELTLAAQSLRTAFDSLSFGAVLGLLPVWFFVLTAGNIATILYSSQIVLFRDDISTEQYLKNSMGIACLLLYFGAVQYLEFFPRYYIMISILKRTTPRVSRFLLGVFPLFVGYALLGMVAFGDQVDRFGDVVQTLRTLFAVVNGDIIFDTFNSVDFLGWGGSLYIYAYIIIFTYVVLMTIIAIVEESFFECSGISVLDRHARTGNDRSVYVDQSENRESTSNVERLRPDGIGESTGKRQLPEPLRALLHANKELEEKRRLSRNSVDHHPFFR